MSADQLTLRVNEALAFGNKLKCGSCPHVIGDAYQRDCAFPDCMPLTLEELVQASSGNINLIADLQAARLAAEKERDFVSGLEILDALKDAKQRGVIGSDRLLRKLSACDMDIIASSLTFLRKVKQP